MSNEAKELRDLALQLQELARNHPAYSMAWPIVTNCSDHLRAMARVVEMQRVQVTDG